MMAAMTEQVDARRGQPTAEARLGSYRLFTDHRLSVDSAVTLFTYAQALAADATVIVDVGCGRGALVDPDVGERRLHDLRGTGRTVIGIDVDPAGSENPIIDEFRAIDGDRWPLDDDSVDLATCDWVLEHIQDPVGFVAELHRVLRPGGAFVARTINKNSLLSLGARAVPNRRHTTALQRLQPQRADRDVFPTAYRMNTLPAVRRLFSDHFDWAVSFHPGLEHYSTRWPAFAATIAAIEPRLPRRAQTVLIVAARNR